MGNANFNLVIKVTEVHLSCLIVFILYLIGLTRIMLYILIFYTPPRFSTLLSPIFIQLKVITNYIRDRVKSLNSVVNDRNQLCIACTGLTLKAPRKKWIRKCHLLKSSASNNCLTLLTNLSIGANRVNPQISIGAVWSGSTLFVIEAS